MWETAIATFSYAIGAPCYILFITPGFDIDIEEIEAITSMTTSEHNCELAMQAIKIIILI